MSLKTISKTDHINVNKQIRFGAMISYSAIAFNILSGLIYTPWMVNQIGQSDYGLYTLATSIITFFVLDFGLRNAVSRFLSKYRAMGDKEGAKKFLGIAYKIFILIATIIFLVLTIVYLLIERIYVELTPEEIDKLKVIFVIAGLFVTISFPFKTFDGILIANERFVFFKLTDLLHKVLIVFLMVIALLMGYGLYALVIVNTFAGLMKYLIKYIYIKRTTDTDTDILCTERNLFKEILGFSAWSTLIGIARRFNLLVTPTVLGAFAGSVQIAIFSIGLLIQGYTWTIAHGLGGLFLPKVTRLTTNNNMNEVENLFIRVGRLQLLVVGLIITGFASMGKEFMYLWMGKDFYDSYYVTLLLITPGIVYNTQEIAYNALIAVNKIKYRAIAYLIAAVISFILSIILSQIYGAIGSAIAIFIGLTIGTVVFMNIVYFKVLKLNIYRFFKECHFRMLGPLLLTGAIGMIIQSYFPVNSLLLFMVKASVLGLIYFILMWFISLNSFEKKLFLGLFNKIKT